MSPPRLPFFTRARLAQAAHALLSQISTRQLAAPPTKLEARPDLNDYVTTLALEAGFVAETVYFTAEEIALLLRRRTPFLCMPLPETGAVYAIVRGGADVVALTADGETVRVAAKSALEQLRGPFDKRFADFAERLRMRAPSLDSSGKLRATLAAELGDRHPAAWGFVFRPNIAESMPRVVRSLELGSQALRFVALSLLQSALTVAAWALIGSLSLTGRADMGSLAGWVLLSLSASVVQIYAVRQVGRFTISTAMLVRQRLLQGAFALEPDGVSAFGIGGLMAVASQTDSFLNSALGLFLAGLGVLTNFVATVSVFSAAPHASWNVLVLLVPIAAVLASAPRLIRLQREQQTIRMNLTTDLVERMLGHRTRLVQQTPISWHDGEDESLLAYGQQAQLLDRRIALLRLVPRAYYALALGVVFVVLVGAPSQETLALLLGGLVLGSTTLSSLVELVISGGTLAALWHAIEPVTREDPTRLVPREPNGETFAEPEAGPVLELRRVRFSYGDDSRPIFTDANLRLDAGEHALVEGRSGGGKTTLVALLSGLLKPSSGIVFAQGLDQHTVRDDDLRRVVASAPQFYKNHVFNGSFAFNLLLGRAWPASDEDVEEATKVATELGLGDLLKRMPAGIQQQVGHTGWQLSHGERSRLYLGRSLLQRSSVLVLDESFGTLDPVTLKLCMDTVLRRARSLIVITHR